MKLIEIKGVREGLLVTTGEGEWQDISQNLLTHLNARKDFLKGAKLYINVGNQILNAVELGHLRDEISDTGLTLWGVLSNSPKTETTAQLLGLATKISKPSQTTRFRNSSSADTTLKDGEPAVMVRRTLRSGYKLQNEGNIVVLGDINPGAEVIAGGSIIVWGRLRGLVHAGAGGDSTASVCALDLSPTQIRINDQIIMISARHGRSQPEIAQIKDGEIIVETWNAGKMIRRGE